MSDLVRISDRFYVGAALESDGELEIDMECIFVDDSVCYTFLDRGEVLALITHLGKVLDDADKEQETER